MQKYKILIEPNETNRVDGIESTITLCQIRLHVHILSLPFLERK